MPGAPDFSIHVSEKMGARTSDVAGFGATIAGGKARDGCRFESPVTIPSSSQILMFAFMYSSPAWQGNK
jgi:hypothetical protein